MSKSWVVAADTRRARIFLSEKSASALQEIKTLTHPEARLHEGDLITDTKEGEPNEHKHDSADRFAAMVCETLEEGRKAGEFDKLYFIAAPAFLGRLRKHQSNPLKQVVAGEVDKNLASHEPAEIRKQLPDFL
jgi:protein required for attachment to host cells